MNYEYRRRSREELSAIAENILRVHAKRLEGGLLDIENLVEEVGFDVIYRPWQEMVHGFVPNQLGLIVVRDQLAEHDHELRWTLAEEFCHIVLEFALWNTAVIPWGADAHTLTDQQRTDIEADAKILAAELLMPVAAFTEHFNRLSEETEDQDDKQRWPHIRRELAKTFIVPWRFAGRRMVYLHFISQEDYERYCPLVM